MLDSIVASTRRRVGRLDRTGIEAAASLAAPAQSLRQALTAPGLGVIAEVKRRSPSAGDIAPALDPVALARDYEAGGAVAISVLTEPDHFGGSDGDLQMVTAASALPVLRKDFVIDPIQVAQARALGAAGVLLIVAILDDATLERLVMTAREWGIDALVEVHDGHEIDRAVAVGADLVGVNNRDLRTFHVDLTTAASLRQRIPEHVTAVAESGVAGPVQAARMAAAGYDAVLVGQAAAAAPDPAAFVRSLGGMR